MLLAFLFCFVTLSACSREPATAASVFLACSTQPDPPAVGVLEVECRISGGQGEPVIAREALVEANMTHPGMQPRYAEMQSDAPGHYKGRIEMTMAGDWYLLVTGRTEKGERFEHTMSLPGVR